MNSILNNIMNDYTNSTNSNNLIDCGKQWKIPNLMYSIEKEYNQDCKCNKCILSTLAWNINKLNKSDFNLIQKIIDNLSPNDLSFVLLRLIPIVEDFDIISKLILKGADVNFIAQFYKDDYTQVSNSLSASVKSKIGLPMVKFLLEHGANPNLCVGKDNVLLVALAYSYTNYNSRDKASDIIDLLLEYNIDIEKSGTSIDEAVASNNITLIKYFLDHPNFENNYKSLNWSPLNYTWLSNNPEVLDLLFTNPLIKADINKQNEDGNTPLHTAICVNVINHYKIEKLLREGANPFIKNKKGKMCFQDNCYSLYDMEIVKLFLLHGVKLYEIIPYIQCLGLNHYTVGWISVLHWNSYMILYCLSQLGNHSNNIMTVDVVEELVQMIQSIPMDEPIEGHWNHPDFHKQSLNNLHIFNYNNDDYEDEDNDNDEDDEELEEQNEQE